MTSAAIVFFLFAAFGGIFLARAVLTNRPTPKPIVFLHGSLALIGVLLLVTYVASGHTDTLLLTSLGLFVLAALGGLTMFVLDMSNKPIPKAFAIVHPLIAASALVVLIVYVMK